MTDRDETTSNIVYVACKHNMIIYFLYIRVYLQSFYTILKLQPMYKISILCCFMFNPIVAALHKCRVSSYKLIVGNSIARGNDLEFLFNVYEQRLGNGRIYIQVSNNKMIHLQRILIAATESQLIR